MSNPVGNLKNELTRWSERAVADGWFTAETAPSVPETDERNPSMLFDSSERPLVVAFFGGTGVGKSSLLNRLAGEAVAKSGVERPTSREITLYVHESVRIERLPAEFPVNKIRQSSHRNDKHRAVLWIDMPDFDSAETANRDLVDQWLPHIDLLVYVVNPERYRDDSGWRMLLKNASRHAWVFIINHWDRGAPGQREAFQSILSEAGLAQPMLFCTDCGPDPQKPNGDEFEQFEAAILELSNQRVIQQLEQHGVLVRVAEARQRLEQATSTLANIPPVTETVGAWKEQWQQQCEKLTGSLDWKLKQLAEPFKEHDTSFMKKLSRAILRRPAPPLPPTRVDVSELVDEGFIDSMELGRDQAVQQTVASGVPLSAARQAVAPLHVDHQAAANVINLELEKSLADPGTPLQRGAYKFLGVLTLLLPLLVLGWAVFKLLTNYQSGQQYLGFDFATHTLLLAGLAWLIPFLLRHFIRPTAQAAAKRGLKNGVNSYLTTYANDTETALAHLEQQRSTLLENASSVFNVLPENILQAVFGKSGVQDTGQIDNSVSRVLIER